MSRTLRMPISAASRRGVSGVAAEAADHRIVLTSLERPVAVVDSAERIDEDLARVRLAARELVDAAADLAASRGKTHSLAAVCERLGLDEDAVRERAAALRDDAPNTRVKEVSKSRSVMRSAASKVAPSDRSRIGTGKEARPRRTTTVITGRTSKRSTLVEKPAAKGSEKPLRKPGKKK